MARSSFSLARVFCQPEGTQDPRDKSRRDGPQIKHPSPRPPELFQKSNHVKLGKETARSAASVFLKLPPGRCRNERDDVGFAKDLKIMTIPKETEARPKLYSLIDEAASTHQVIVITGKIGNAVLVSVEDWNLIAETLYLLSVPRMRESIKEGMETPITEWGKELNW
jgi:antitoxin YefM